jgi:hypothetical protein
LAVKNVLKKIWKRALNADDENGYPASLSHNIPQRSKKGKEIRQFLNDGIRAYHCIKI